jgi:hypothetical protein
MAKLSVFDPPMCCSTGVCGPAVDPVLPRFSADLDWLRSKGVEVERANLSQQPAAFAGNPAVLDVLRKSGNDCLPLILVDGRIVVCGRYPDRAELAELAGVGAGASLVTVGGGERGCCDPSGGASCC